MENLCCNKMSSFTNSSNSKLDSKLDSTKFATPVTSVQHCVTAIEQWMAASRLRLNTDKTELIWTLDRH